MGAPNNIQREDMPYCLPNGKEITLQEVALQKTITVAAQVRVTRVNDMVDTFEAISEPISIDCESVIMCAPEGTDVDCMILDSSLCRVSNLERDTGLTATGTVSLLICQGIQSNAMVKLEVLARFCQPRKEIKIPVCKTPIVPKQCDAIFPGNANNDDCGC